MQSSKTIICVTFLIAANFTFNSYSQPNSEIDWREQIIYMALTDRFYNGKIANDTL